MKEPTDAWVADGVVARLEAQDFVSVLMTEPDESKQRQAVSDITSLKKETQQARQMLERSELTRADFVDHHRCWEARMDRAQDVARPAGSPEVLLRLMGSSAREAWDSAGIHERRTALDWLVRVTILPVGRGNRRVFDTGSVRVVWREHTRS